MFVKLQMWKKQIALFGENQIALEQHFKPFLLAMMTIPTVDYKKANEAWVFVPELQNV